MDGTGIFPCSCSDAFKSLTLQALLNHYFILHRNETNFRVTCNVDGCPAMFKKYNSFYKHVYIKKYMTSKQKFSEKAIQLAKSRIDKMTKIQAITLTNTMMSIMLTSGETELWMKISRRQIRYLILSTLFIVVLKEQCHHLRILFCA